MMSIIFLISCQSLFILKAEAEFYRPELKLDGTYKNVYIFPCTGLSRLEIRVSGRLFDDNYKLLKLEQIQDLLNDYECIDYPTADGYNVYMIKSNNFDARDQVAESSNVLLASNEPGELSTREQQSASSGASQSIFNSEDSISESPLSEQPAGLLGNVNNHELEITIKMPKRFDYEEMPLVSEEPDVHQVRPVLTAAFVIGIILTICIVIGGFILCWVVIKYKSYKTVAVEQVPGSEIEMEELGEDEDSVLPVAINGFYKSVCKWLVLIMVFTIILALMMAFITIITGFGAFALKSCECSKHGAFCNRQLRLPPSDKRLVYGEEEGYCVFVNRLKLESGFSCKGGNSEYDDLKDSCKGEFEDIEADICSHYCPFGQKKGKCTTCEFEIKPCMLIRHVSLRLNVSHVPQTISADLDIMPKCDQYVLIDGQTYCASSFINTIASLDVYNFFTKEPSFAELKAIVISRGYITPSSVTCHHKQDTGFLQASSLSIQVSVQVLATFESVNESFCHDNITDFDCTNTPVSGVDTFTLLRSCFDRANMKVNHANEPIRSHCNCYWCVNGPDTHPCNSNDAARNGTEYNDSDKDMNRGENSEREWFEKNWMFLLMGIVAFIMVVAFSVIAIGLYRCCGPK